MFIVTEQYIMMNKRSNVSSERLIELTLLFLKGIQVFNEKENLIVWLNRLNRA
jgi:hypothetical protein